MDLVELEAIKRLKYRYLRCLDLKLWDEIRECFTEDATAAYSGGRYAFRGREAIVGFLERAMGATTFLSSHRVHHPEIDFESDTEARGTWALDDVVIETRFAITIRGAAFYEDRYRKEGGVWRISETGYRRVFEEVLPRASIAGLELTAHWWETKGRSRLPAPGAE